MIIVLKSLHQLTTIIIGSCLAKYNLQSSSSTARSGSRHDGICRKGIGIGCGGACRIGNNQLMKLVRLIIKRDSITDFDRDTLWVKAVERLDRLSALVS